MPCLAHMCTESTSSALKRVILKALYSKSVLECLRVSDVLTSLGLPAHLRRLLCEVYYKMR